jgi:hypothetical protein
MTNHPTQDWEWDDYAEEGFVEWFNGDYGSPYSLRSEYFFGDCLVLDEKTRQDIMYKYLHSAFCSGYKCALYKKLKTEVENDNK